MVPVDPRGGPSREPKDIDFEDELRFEIPLGLSSGETDDLEGGEGRRR